MVPIKCILTILLAVCCQCKSFNLGASSSSWAKLKISPDTFSSMKYGNFLIEIYEHANNNQKSSDSQKKYFYSPIALLDHSSAVSIYNRFTKQPEMRFRIEMWNDKVENEVVKYLNKIVGQEIQPDNVRVLHLDKVILTSKRASTEEYFLSPEWTNYDKSKTLWFSLLCYDQKVCDELANEMRSNPKHLDHFKLLYSLSSQTSQTKQTTISIDSVTSGQMVSTLLQKFGDKKEIFLTANDEKKMLAETATNIRMDTFDDSEVGSPDTEFQISNILKDLLVTSKTTIKDQSDKMWDSVFWNEENYRPDKTTKTLNEILNKLDRETQKKLADMFQKVEKQSVILGKLTSNSKANRREEQHRNVNVNEKWKFAKNNSDEENKNVENKERIQHNFNANSWADVDRISSTISEKMANESDGSSQVEITKEDVEKLLQESKNHVEWDGEKFVPKPMQLSKINLGKFRDSQSFQDRNIRVRYTTAELSAPIKIMEHAELTVVNEWNNLKEELKATTELLSRTVNNLNITNTELRNAKSDLTNELEGTRQELEKTQNDLEETRVYVNNLSIKLNETKQELVKTRADFLITVDDLSAKLNATKKELAETKITTGKLSTEFKTNSDRLGKELRIAEENLKKDLRATSNNLETTKTILASTRTELNSTKSAVADLATKSNVQTSEIVDIGKMPTSCADLQQIGHKLSGFFSVKGSKKMEMIYCNFNANQNDKQKWIGYADVKSASVHFYVQRESSFYPQKTPIPFDLARVNEGNTMNLTSGIFTAPRPGIYYFSFTGVARLESSSYANFYSRLYLNGNIIGSSNVHENKGPVDQWSPLTLQSTLNLKKGDRVWMQISYSSSSSFMYDNIDHRTHFTGFMLDEEIVASL
ncbi:interaptin-like isoform X1 [Daphnia pulicaria]|uniref:interaptin-like isoform X1 n=1 Tax=Daphnia pulicaria TaxID=35523 RepID=UPI001EE9CAD7|nr:interaptin-like isoform X1 [Daphnia pulicaria]